MALTPEDVSNKRFTTVRLREGYDMTEVDQFLDEVEAELTRCSRENAELRAQLQAALGGEPVPPLTSAADPGPASPAPSEDAAAPAVEATVAMAPGAAGAEDGAEGGADGGAGGGAGGGPSTGAAPVPATAASVETLRVTTTAEASVAAARLLELAGSNADQLVAEARAQAEQIVGDSTGRAEALEAEARARADALEAETEERRTALFGDIDQEKSRLDQEIETLRTFEREYRAELKTYFEDQLAALDGHGAGGVLGHSERAGDQAPRPEGSAEGAADGSGNTEPSRLQAILGDDQG